MILLGIDVGTSSVKVSAVDAATQKVLASAAFPETEAPITALQPGWAEQAPADWWDYTKQAILKCNASAAYNPKDIDAIGIAYQMHGLVALDKKQQCLRNSIIWCDSRAVPFGNKAFKSIGEEKCLSHLLNSPGNFTAAKLAWVKENEPDLFKRIDKIMLPGDYIAMQLTGEVSTTVTALSEGMFWDFKNNSLSKDVMDHFGFDEKIIPPVKDVFSIHGQVSKTVTDELGLKSDTPISYKSGDQPNNAFSLNVLKPGEVAATAGTSGVIYAVSNTLDFDPENRVNSFAHVNYTAAQKMIGVLLCINGAGIANKWIKNLAGNLSYDELNKIVADIPIGSEGLQLFPFGNGAERMLGNKILSAHISNIDFNRHSTAHLYHAAQEGIAFAFRYGLDIMRSINIKPAAIKAGYANMFLSAVFTEAFVNATNTPLELYQNDGSVGAALGAGIGASIFKTSSEAFTNLKPVKTIMPEKQNEYENAYRQWKGKLEKSFYQNSKTVTIWQR